MPGQHQVEHDEVGLALLHAAQRLLPVGGLDHLVPVGPQVGHHHLADGVVVVNHEHECQGVHLPRLGGDRSDAATCR